MKKLLLILSAALALAACKDENPVFTISTEELKFDANGGEQKVFISTNRDWTAQVPQTDTWYTVSALSGTSDTEVTSRSSLTRTLPREPLRWHSTRLSDCNLSRSPRTVLFRRSSLSLPL